ncbi:copper homeostasis protein CutC [Kitasatospora aureofaciens]|uniref:Copper homeostasis protein cutC homolog n=1 Tax=Kitasatospora aureofaciens TaxID=1894 RepID=A0A1E7N783_KITAU|nr:copper homeostasis protein CutC [Kitasatospora aureofaciens]ARF79139.1 copper homeostasis protein CutC [Kitasatospora aureofaciens]OEV36557.1 copper homeostasis protein CutC [Kitasatospora aureofaciens]QEV00343.1 copper homeostasis protein CutC [Streptomyces viridifaciens]UKZ06565.1 copper homeostasis protein CutC [Streptomyces viridifaciens]
MSRPIFEVIALTPQDAQAAESGGADRLELVTDMAADGLTPSVEDFARIRAAVGIPLRVMLRIRDGFAPGDLDELCARAAALRAEGAEEFVLGFLDAEGAVDLAATTTVAEAIAGCCWTFHRAIDHGADRAALRAAVGALPGLDTFLTSGAAAGVDAGREVLAAELARTGEPGYTQRILIGGGLRAEHLKELRADGFDAFHVGGAVRVDGWHTPVDAARVAEWRALIDA